MKLFCTLFFLWFAFLGKAQEVVFVDQSQDSNELENYIFDKTSFEAYQVAFKDSVKLFCDKSNIPRNLQIHIRFTPTNLPYYSFSARPALTDLERHQLQKTLMHLPAIKTNKLIYTKEFNVIGNGGGAKDIPYSPLLEDASKFKKEPYEFGNLAEDFNQIKRWSKEVELMVISNSIESAVDKTDMGKPAVNVYTYALHSTLIAISQGRFGFAQKMIPIFVSLTPNASLTHYLIKELQWRLGYYFRAEKRICYTLPQKEGDRYGKNLIALDSILSINPMSEFALFETLQQGIPTDKELLGVYQKTRKNFNYSNPLRTDTLPALTATEAYQNSLRIRFLYLSGDLKSITNLEEIAEIGLELGAYEFSNNLYSILFFKSFELEKTGNPIYRLCEKFAAFKLDPTLKTYDKKDLKSFKQLDRELKNKMLNSTGYQNFKKRK
jgi:hypothetical protein